MDRIFEAGNIFQLFLFSAVITSVLTGVSIIILKKLNIVDYPGRKHPAIIHKIPIPRGGGIPLFLGVLITSLIFIDFNPILNAIFLAGGLALVIGVLDDKFDISPYIRFVLNIVCALIVVGAGLNISFITNPLGGILFLDKLSFEISLFGLNLFINAANIFAVLWIVWVMNMLNWSKGVDGQMPGVVAISGIVIGLLSLRFSTLDETTILAANLSFIIAGAAVGFLVYNFHPAKIFPGYGATSIYLLLAVVSILSSAKLATAILVMGVPIADGAFTIIRRLATGHSPFRHDKKHFHHLLLELGFGQRRIALFYWVISAILGSLALVLTSRGKLFAIIMVVILVGGALFFLNLMLRERNDKNSI